MSFLFENNAVSTLLSGINDTVTTINVQAGDGALFPSPTGNDSFRVTLQDSSNNIEICDCTSRTGDALTVVRGQEGTTGLSWLAGDVIELRLTKAILEDYRQGVGDEVQTTAISRAVGTSDRHDIIEVTAAATITLPDANTTGEGWQLHLKNNHTAPITIARTTGSDTIDGVQSNLSLGAGGAIFLSTNAALDGFTTLYNAAQQAYPVGAVFLSVVATNPNTLLGFGTWSQIEGRFLVGVGDNGDGKSYANGETGGQKDQSIVDHDHTITDPGHIHTVDSNQDNSNNGPTFGHNSRTPNQSTNETNSATTGISVDNVDPAGVAAAEDIQASGDDLNLPPYFALYMWQRTA